MTPTLELDYQVAVDAVDESGIPDEKDVKQWLLAALGKAGYSRNSAMVSVRIVGDEEIQNLNSKYRNIDKATNVLSFPYVALPGVDIDLLGDIVVCASVVKNEAIQQSKDLGQHWAHMMIHGLLHLLGYDHIEDQQAEIMESLEIDILSSLGVANPYGEINTP